MMNLLYVWLYSFVTSPIILDIGEYLLRCWESGVLMNCQMFIIDRELATGPSSVSMVA
jgi:hypothetical protein